MPLAPSDGALAVASGPSRLSAFRALRSPSERFRALQSPSEPSRALQSPSEPSRALQSPPEACADPPRDWRALEGFATFSPTAPRAKQMLLSLAGGGGAPTSDETFAGVDIMLSLHKGQHAKNTRVVSGFKPGDSAHLSEGTAARGCLTRRWPPIHRTLLHRDSAEGLSLRCGGQAAPVPSVRDAVGAW